MSRSQEHPVMNAAAAGGKMIATIMSRTSDPRTMMSRVFVAVLVALRWMRSG